MCAEANIKTTDKAIREALGVPFVNKTGEVEWNKRIKLTDSFPTVESPGSELELQSRIFPAVPFPNSRLSDLVPSKVTGEEEIVRIYERPTWKDGFSSNRCLTVLTSFFEPAYWGDEAGTVQEFSSQDDNVLFIASIKIQPKKPATGKLDGVSLLTHTPNDVMIQFHHRLLVFLKPEHGLEWISGGKSDPYKKFEYLVKHRYIPNLKVRRERTMAKGWDKRVEHHLHALEDEKRYMSALKNENIIA